jgi:hypothetical protein
MGGSFHVRWGALIGPICTSDFFPNISSLYINDMVEEADVNAISVVAPYKIFSYLFWCLLLFLVIVLE